MGQDLRYRSGAKAFEWRISRSDWETLEAIRALQAEDVETLFHVSELGVEVALDSHVVHAAAERLARFIEKNSHRLPRTYQFKVGSPPHPLMSTGFGAGGLSGIRLPGDSDHWYSIWAGSGMCYLERFAVRPDGRGTLAGQTDLRGVEEVVTDNMGTIAIRSRPAKTELRRVLRDIVKFANACGESAIVKTVE